MEATLEQRIEEAEKKLSMLFIQIQMLEARVGNNQCRIFYKNILGINPTKCRICGKEKSEHLM